MTITLNAYVVKHERRLRLLFTDALAAGAFTSISFYTVTCLDGVAPSPNVQRAFAVANSPHVVELQLDTDLVGGAQYSFSAVGVPGASGGVTPDPSTISGQPARPRQAASPTISVSAFDELLYGWDVERDTDTGDYLETPAGDLATVRGAPLVNLDLLARMLADGLPHDAGYGLKARGSVDGPPGGMLPLRARAIGQLRLDNRVSRADAAIDLTDPTAPILTISPTLVGANVGRGIAPFNVPITR